MVDLTQVQIKAINDRVNQMKLYDEHLRIAEERNSNEIADLVKTVNDIFLRNGIAETIDASHIRFNADFIGNVSRITDKKLSTIIFDSIYPKSTLKLFSHFTTFDGACSILANKELWIFNLIKNFDAEEFRLFYEHHNITGYRDLRDTFGIRTDYRSLMSEIFSLCLTSDTNNSPSLWGHFGYGGTGIKLTFEVNSKIPDFREVYYSKNTPEKIPLLEDLFDTIAKKYNYPLNFSYISKIGGFYIHGKFKNEQEYRFLVKRTSDNYNASGFVPVNFKDDVSYIVLPFTSHLADFKLKKVTKGPNCSSANFDMIKTIINSTYTEQIEIEEL